MNQQRNVTGRQQFPRIAGAAFFLCYLAWQATFAATCFVSGYACDLTWTMYSGRSENPKIFVIWQSGEETLLDKDEGINGVGKVLGGKVDEARFVPPYLCEHFSEARSIRLAYEFAGTEETIPCSP